MSRGWWVADVTADLLAGADACFQTLETYRVTARAVDGDGGRQEVHYAYRKPGWVRMEFIRPHRGALAVYDPHAREVRVWPLGLSLGVALNLAPQNPLIRSPSGHRVDQSDVGALLANLRMLRDSGRASSLGDMQMPTRLAHGVEVEGAAGVSVAGVHRYRVWFAHDNLFPLLVKSFGANGNLIERVDMTDAEVDVVFPEGFFTP